MARCGTARSTSTSSNAWMPRISFCKSSVGWRRLGLCPAAPSSARDRPGRRAERGLGSPGAARTGGIHNGIHKGRADVGSTRVVNSAPHTAPPATHRRSRSRGTADRLSQPGSQSAPIVAEARRVGHRPHAAAPSRAKSSLALQAATRRGQCQRQRQFAAFNVLSGARSKARPLGPQEKRPGANPQRPGQGNAKVPWAPTFLTPAEMSMLKMLSSPVSMYERAQPA